MHKNAYFFEINVCKQVVRNHQREDSFPFDSLFLFHFPILDIQTAILALSSFRSELKGIDSNIVGYETFPAFQNRTSNIIE